MCSAVACPWYLLLNPDAVLAKGALAAFAQRLSDPSVGLCGATVLRFETPDVIQACGGAAMRPLSLLGKNLGGEMSAAHLPDRDCIEQELDYPLGAAIAFRDDYVRKVGLLDERFFLYYEEADWTLRGKPHYRPGWANDAFIFHHHGASAGSRLTEKMRSPLADYHMTRSRILFALRWRPILLPLLMMIGCAQTVRRLARGNHRQARAILSAWSDFAWRPRRTNFARPAGVVSALSK